MKNKIVSLILSCLVLPTTTLATERPPQFVLLAFDNCQENQSWEQISKFLDGMNATNPKTVRFTFFLSAVGLLSDRAKASYTDPMGRSGKSNINFGGLDKDVVQRIQWINRLHQQGNEIASHAVGHFPGKNWSVDQWRHEFDQYNYIIDHVADIHGFKADQAKQATLAFSSQQLRGFRAPYLEGGKNLNLVLAERGYDYDTSDTNQGWEPNTWPKKYPGITAQKGLWNFGLGFITLDATQISEENRIAGNSRVKKSLKLPAMDYNFCFRQTGGCPVKDPYKSQQEADADEMLAGYLQYLLINYNGNRAPVNIGHHFEQYRGGSYNRALMKFARAVCTLPEVRCVTYSELSDYMEKLSPSDRQQFQSGNFPKAPRVSIEQLLSRVQK